MPHYIVQYKGDIARRALSSKGEFLWRLKASLSALTASELSVRDRLLTSKDSTFLMIEEGPFDKLLKDILIIVFAHADEERLIKGSDNLAESIGQAVADAASGLRLPFTRAITFSVSLCLGEMGYFAGSVEPKT